MSLDIAPLPASPAASVQPIGLAALEARLAEDLSLLELPARGWVFSRTHETTQVLDVAVIGGGMAGLAAAAALKLLGVRARIFDRSPQGFEGPWATTARMETLRSPKQLTGPAPGLTGAHVPRVVRSPVRQGRMGGARQDRPAAMDGVSRLVPPRAGTRRAQQPHRRSGYAARRRPRRIEHAHPGTTLRRLRAARGAGDRT